MDKSKQKTTKEAAKRVQADADKTYVFTPLLR